MKSKRLGEVKEPFVVWLFVTFYFAVGIALSGSSTGTLPQNVTPSLVLSLLLGIAEGWGVILAFLIIFLALWERRRSLREFSLVWVRGEGVLSKVCFGVLPCFHCCYSLLVWR